MDWMRNLSSIQVDPTSHCNAMCGACVRNTNGLHRKDTFTLSHFDFSTWKRMWESDLNGVDIKTLIFNGNWGDAGMQPKLLEMIDLVTTTHPNIHIQIATNAGMRRSEWWYKLGNVLSTVNHDIEFAIDGLSDTHSVYRRGTEFAKVMDNARAFINGGGNASWYMTLFKHNAHQVDECRKLAKDTGFWRYRTRKSNAERMLIEEENGDEHMLYAEYNVKPEESNFFFPNNPTGETYGNTQCDWYNLSRVQIDPWGRVWPCCHISHYGVEQFKHKKENPKNDINWDIEKETYGDFNDLKTHTLQDILNSKWYSNRLPKAIDSAEWNVCKRQCGVKAI